MKGNDYVSDFEDYFEDTLSILAQKFFGVPYLFPYQRLVITNILESAFANGITIHLSEKEKTDFFSYIKRENEHQGRQIVILPTGSGKSLCFQLPAMLLDGVTLVIYPILSLMADQKRRLEEQGYAPAILRGGQSKEERDILWEEIYSRKKRIIIANPEILLVDQIMERLKGLGIVHIVIDEAHCVSEWGESFRPNYLKIAKIISATNASIITAFTATASALVLEKISKYIFSGKPVHKIIGNPDRKNIRYEAKGCIIRDLAVRDLIIKNKRPCIVFCSSRLGTEELSRYLRNELGDKEIRFYHAGLNREEKTIVEKWFLNNPVGILVATCAYGMGVDKADIRTVIHRDCPPSVEAYLQESGRVGRDGLQSKAILLWGPDDEINLKHTKSEEDKVRITKLFSYGRNTVECRRRVLLSLLDYEGDEESPESMCCDVCDGEASNILREEKTLMEFFKQNPRCYTIAESAHTLSTFKQLGLSKGDAQKLIQYLLDKKFLWKINNIFWKNKLVATSGFKCASRSLQQETCSLHSCQ